MSRLYWGLHGGGSYRTSGGGGQDPEPARADRGAPTAADSASQREPGDPDAQPCWEKLLELHPGLPP